MPMRNANTTTKSEQPSQRIASHRADLHGHLKHCAAPPSWDDSNVTGGGVHEAERLVR